MPDAKPLSSPKPAAPAPKANLTHVVGFASAIAGAHVSTKGIDKLSATALQTVVDLAFELESLVRLRTSSPSA